MDASKAARMPDRTHADIIAWARGNWPGGDPGHLEIEPIVPDGSIRLFLRLQAGGTRLVAMHNPDNPAENRAWDYIASHLSGLGLPVAGVKAKDMQRGLFLMEDLGSGSLQDAAKRASSPQDIAAIYEPVLAVLARLQAKGAQGFDLSVCFDSKELTPEFLLEREAGYFLQEFVLGACGYDTGQLPDGLERDLAELCQRAGRAQPQGLVHRDFQSRNIVYEEGKLGLVDFQGARLGPAQYDLASLLHDPYVDLPAELRDQLKSRYMELRVEEGPFSGDEFEQGWPYVSASRVMQALGAYAFLTRRRGRAHFGEYIPPALSTLRTLCAGPAFEDLGSYRQLVQSLPHVIDPEALKPLEKETQ
jgi:aminoglycoside/choline kinase family phosphotransferase